jgi:hypothetical protein
MLKTVEAIIEPDGTIRTLEPLRVEVATRAIITLIDPSPNGLKIWNLLQSPRFINRPISEASEVAQRIEDLRCDEFWTNDDRLSKVAGSIAINLFNDSAEIGGGGDRCLKRLES